MTHGLPGVALLAGALATVSAVASADPLPSQVDLRPAFERFGLPPKSQGKRGCCSLFAMCGVLEFEFALSTGAHGERLSEEYLNWASHRSNGRTTDGSFFSDGLRGLRMHGLCSEALMPYAPEYDPEIQPSEHATRDAAARKDIAGLWIKSWDVETGMTPKMLARIKGEIASGHPVAIGMRWPKRESYDSANVLAVPAPEDVFDGHSIVLVGYRDDDSEPGGGVFTFRNSAGSGWRESGCAYLPYAYVEAYGNDALSMRVGGGRPINANQPGPGAVQFEDLEVTDSVGCSPSVQKMGSFGGDLWSGGQQLFVSADSGASITLALPAAEPGRFELSLWATRAPDFGTIQLSVDGERVGDPIDLYDPEVLPTGRVILGAVTLAAGMHDLAIRVIGRNQASSGQHFGLDCLEIAPR